MAEQNISKFRLALNGVGTLGIAILFLSAGLPGLLSLATGASQMGSDPDGGDKVLGIQIIAVVVGVIALVSFIRTVMT